ncbi:hypothetical protein N7510_003085 [Penicillium lagena]|uniref:uncharacterized protein n=1 Tax=Penicillium lagena TaxID=94218 RepID=UPI00254207FC|nr:uncharacterized protein N7510_003085 [Penicillium lagena]KAJ5619101.1 hypothetical protein N7510_003085 [Penicillium lagena]
MALENQTTMPHFQNSSSSDGSSPVTFVSESSKSEVRSHAMRHHWRRRQRRNSEIKLHHKQTCRKLLPGPMVKAQVSKPKKNDTNGLVGRQRDNFNIEDDQGDDDQVGVYKQSDFSIALQLLRGFDHALSTSTFDPFQTCPIQLTPQHHKLLHHWISTHAAMMFEDLNITDFNPMKDVWFPLDLSNASSFNCVMAHSAAHIAHLYSGTSSGRETSSSDALMFKAEAVRILNLWLADPGKKLSDDAFAAVIRLLTFERYWGTEAEWNVHRNGLKGMIEAKGGVENLHDNWRLELVVYLWAFFLSD